MSSKLLARLSVLMLISMGLSGVSTTALPRGLEDLIFADRFEGEPPISGLISGRLFTDPNFDGDLADGEPLAGVTIYLDQNYNGRFDPDEPSVTTGADGRYLFSGVSAGIKHVRQHLTPPGVQTFPGAGEIPVFDMLPDEVVDYIHAAPGVGQFDVPYGENASDWPAGWGDLDLGPNAEPVELVDLVLKPIGVRKIVPGIGTYNGTEFLNLPTDASITVRFDEHIIDGPGPDLIIHSISGASRSGNPELEQAEVLIGPSESELVSVGIRPQESTIALDLADHDLIGPIQYVKVISQNNAGGWWGFELVGMEAINIASPDPNAHIVNVTATNNIFEDRDFGRYFQDLPPTVVIGATDSDPGTPGFRVGESITLQVNASDDLGIASVTLTVNGQNVALDENNAAQVVLAQAGELFVEAIATDIGDQTATRTARYYILNADGSYPFDPNLIGAGGSEGVDPPVLRILAPAIGASLAQDVEVVATMTGTPEPVEWTLEYAPVDLIDPFDLAAPDPDYIEIASGSGNVFSAPIGTVPLASLADGIYFLRLSASNSPTRVAYFGQVLAKNVPEPELRPEIVIDGPESGASASVSAVITGTIQSSRPLIEWYAEYAPADTVDLNNPGSDLPDWVRFAEGTETIPVSQAIANFDATLVRNNSYVVRIVARNDIGLGRVEGILLDVVGEAKLGRNRLEMVDLKIELDGFPLEFVRVYDSLEADISGDLGYGWSLQLRDADIRETVPDTGTQGLFGSTPFRDGTRVYLNAPGGERLAFTFKPEPGTPSPVGQPYRAVFEPDPGNYHRLEVPQGDQEFLALNPDGSVSLFFFNFPWNPERYVLIEPDGTRYTYHEDSGLLQAEDLNGNTLTFNPDAIQHSSGQQLRFERDGQGRITGIIDPEGNTWSYGYDAAGDLVSHTTPDGNTSVYTYLSSPAHFLDTLFDPQGRQPLRHEYDPDSGRLLAIIDEDGNRHELTFDPFAFTGTQSDRRGNVTAFDYDERGNIIRIEDPKGNVTQYEYNDPANPDRETRMIDPEGGIWDYEYNQRGQPTVLKTPMASGSSNQVTRIEYDALGNMTEYKDPDNNVSTYSYDALGNRTAEAPYNGIASQFEYGSNGKRVQRLGGGSFAVSYEYDANGFVRRQSDPTGYELHLTHLANGRLTQRSDNAGDLLVAFTPGGTLSSQTDTAGNSIVLVENPDGSMSRSDRTGNLTTLNLDAENRPTVLELANGGQVVTTHDPDGNVDVITDPVGNMVDHDFDETSELVAITDHLGNSDSFAHDANGNIIEIVDRNGKRRTFEYDANQRLIHEYWHDGGGVVIRTISWNYAPHRGLVEVLDDTGDAVYGQSTASNNLLRPTRVDYALPGQEDWRVTLNRSPHTDYPVAVGARISIYAHQSIFFVDHYGGDSAALNWTHPGGGGNYVQIFRNPDSTVREIFRRTGFGGSSATMRTRVSHDGLQRVASIRHEDTTGVLLHPSAELFYTRDAEGRLIDETHEANTALIDYDAAGQVLAVNHSNPAYADESYSYDLAGNRLTSHLTTGTATIAPPNRLLASGDWAFEYDLAGNLIKRTNAVTGRWAEFEYDHRNRLIRAATYPGLGDPTEDVLEFEYDYLDRMLYRIVNGQKTWILNALDHPVAEFADGSDQISAAFLFDPSATDAVHAAWRDDALGERWFLHDQLGSVRGITDADFNLLSWVDYDSFGNLQPGSSPAMDEPIRFAARPFLAPLGLYDNRRRFMDPAQGRFTQEDPIRYSGRDFNLYRYAHNSPLVFTDPTGEAATAGYALVFGEIIIGEISKQKAMGEPDAACHIASWSASNFAYFNPLAKLIMNPQSASNGGSIEREPPQNLTGCASK